MSAFINAMDARTVTENGAPTLATTGSPLVDLFTKLVRDLDGASLEQLFAKARADAGTDPTALADLFVLAFQTRDCRNGKGEKALFYKLAYLLADALGDDSVVSVLSLVPEYGYFKDLLAIAAVKPESRVAAACVEIFADSLAADEAELKAATAEGRTPKLSLAGKYAPRENGAYDKKLGLAAKLALKLKGTAANKPAAQRRYRKLVASLNAALNTPEVLMCSARWAEIRFATVASLCLQRHRKAFLNELVKGKMPSSMEATGNRKPEDADRVTARENLRAALASKGVKGKQLQPHEIAAKLMNSGYSRRGAVPSLSTAERDLMAAQWASMKAGVLEGLAKAKEARDAAVAAAAGPQQAEAAGLDSVTALKAALPKAVDLGKLVPLVDVSGSMSGTPMEVAIGLGILVSELTSPAFKDRILTFESTPSWVELSDCADIAAKVGKVQSAPWGGSTDFAAACERILVAAEKAKLRPDEVPDLIVFSDMQFDVAGGYDRGYFGEYYGYRNAKPSASWETHYERLERRFAEVGVAVCGQAYAPPRIIFWNLRASVGFPVQKDAPNTQMLSGFSPSLLKLVLTGAELVAEEKEEVMADGTVRVKREGPTPEQTLRAALDDPAYDAVRLKLSELTSGPLKEYVWEKEGEEYEMVAEEKEEKGEGEFEMVDVM